MPSSPSPTTSPSPTASPVLQARHASVSSSRLSASTGSHNAPQLAVSTTAADGARRPSIQFAAHSYDSRTSTVSSKAIPYRVQRRMSSPPPPAAFENRVSFDTFDNKDASDYSLTLNSKHKDYHYTQRSRTFLCGTDQNDYSDFALEWLIDELVEDGDEVVCLRVVDKDSKISSDASVAERRYQAEAKKLLDQVIEKNTEEKAISLILEYAVGKVHDTIQRMIHIYEPAILIVGTRGKSLSGFQGLLPGSVSKYCLQHSPVPVIVVRSGAKREKKKRKRQKDPARKGYLDILEKSGAKGTHMLDRSNRDSMVGNAGPATAEEAEAVAAAIGQPISRSPQADMAPLSRVQSGRSDATSPESDFSPEGGPRSPGIIMKSPDLANLESPATSESEDSDDDGGDGLPNFEAVPGSMLTTNTVEDVDTDEDDVEQATGPVLTRTGPTRETGAE